MTSDGGHQLGIDPLDRLFECLARRRRSPRVSENLDRGDASTRNETKPMARRHTPHPGRERLIVKKTVGQQDPRQTGAIDPP